MNSVCLTGRLTNDPTLTGAREDVMKCRIAINEGYYNEKGEWIDRAVFVNVTKFKADKLAPRLHKGKQVAVQGKLQYSQWEDKNGQKCSEVSVIAQHIDLFGDGKKDAPIKQTVADAIINGDNGEQNTIPF